MNEVVLFELYGPEDYDYAFLNRENAYLHGSKTESGYQAEMGCNLDRPGTYRLRSACCDLAGRTDVVWTEITIEH